MKKNFTGGLNSLLGEQPKKVTPAKKRAINQRALYSAMLEESKNKSTLLGDQTEKPKRGRPVTQTKEITKSSQEGTKENETRATFIIKEDLLDKLKAVAYWDRMLIKDVINTALTTYIDNYEKKRGRISIEPIKDKSMIVYNLTLTKR
jgi:hypothetical protein